MDQTETTGDKASLHIAYNVEKNDKGEFWNKIGVGWMHKDGKGATAHVSCVPLDGRIVLRLASENKN